MTTEGKFRLGLKTWSEAGSDAEAGKPHCGYVFADPATLVCRSGPFALQAGMYFCLPGPFSIEHGAGLILSAAESSHEFFLIGGLGDSLGRLQHINGCPASLLLPPTRLGDPFHIPRGTRQSPLSHPSFRLGMIISGQGLGATPMGERALNSGNVFHIPRDCL